MNQYRTSMVRCIENNKIYDAVTMMLGMNSQLDDANRVIFSTALEGKPRADRDTVKCPYCGESYNPKPNLAVIVDSKQPIRKCMKCDKIFDYLECAIFVKGIYNIFRERPSFRGYRQIRKHRESLYRWFNEAVILVDSAFRNYRLNYKSSSGGNNE